MVRDFYLPENDVKSVNHKTKKGKFLDDFKWKENTFFLVPKYNLESKKLERVNLNS